MVTLVKQGIYLLKGQLVLEETGPLDLDKVNTILSRAGLAPLSEKNIDKERARGQTISSQILNSHNRSGDQRHLKLQFDALTSHDITYVGIIQTARASGLKEFPVPYVLTNCHNSLCAVGERSMRMTMFSGSRLPANSAAFSCPPIRRSFTSTCGR